MSSRVPEGYVGNLNDEQQATLNGLKEKVTKFVTDDCGGKVGTAPSYSEICATRPQPAAPTGPIEPASKEEEADEANRLLASDADLLRFCRARQFDVDKASEMAINNIKWRASVKPWAIVPENCPKALPSGVWRWAGYTKSGMPILHVDCENWKPTEYYGVDEYIRYLAYILEGAVARMGEGTSRLCVIYWIPSLSMEMMGSRASECAKVLMKVMQDQFPERLGVAFTCNAPALFSAMWKMVSPWIDPVTKAKFQIVPRGQSEETLLRYIDADVLAKSLGGNHEEYPIPNRWIMEENADIPKPPAATNINAMIGVSDKTILNGGLVGSYDGLISVRPGYDYSMQVHLEENTKSVSWNFTETSGREFNFGYKVTEVAAAPAPALGGMGMMGGGYGGGMFGGGAASVIASKGAGMLMSQDPAPVTTFPQSGSVEIQKGWANGTLNLIFDNTAARFFSANVTYTINVDAAE